MVDQVVEEKQEQQEVQEATEEKQPFQMTQEELANATSGGDEQGTSTEETEQVETEKSTEKEQTVKDTEKTTTEEAVTTTISVEEFEKLQRKAEKNDKLLAKLGTELGMYRKVSPEEEVDELQKIRDAYVDDPIKGNQLYEAYKERKAAEYQESQKRQVEELEQNTKEVISKVAPDFKDRVKEIVEILKSDGYKDNVITSFKENPYLYGADTLFQLYRRVDLQKSFSELQKEVDKLKKENEELRKKPGKLLSDIEKETWKKKVTSKAGDQTNEDVSLDKPAFLMTKEELAKSLSGG